MKTAYRGVLEVVLLTQLLGLLQSCLRLLLSSGRQVVELLRSEQHLLLLHVVGAVLGALGPVATQQVAQVAGVLRLDVQLAVGVVQFLGFVFLYREVLHTTAGKNRKQ